MLNSAPACRRTAPRRAGTVTPLTGTAPRRWPKSKPSLSTGLRTATNSDAAPAACLGQQVLLPNRRHDRCGDPDEDRRAGRLRLAARVDAGFDRRPVALATVARSAR